MNVLVTGAAGMIGGHLVDALVEKGYTVVAVDRRTLGKTGAINIVCDLADREQLKRVLEENKVDRIIHLAALAHTAGEKDLSWERYYHVNVECAENVFYAAAQRSVLFISTVDVFGFTKGIVDGNSPVSPVTVYGKSKALAEEKCRQICKKYTIFRFSPVYTPDIKRDIQKRYYLKYPNLAYRIGKGTEYEVLDVAEAVRQMADWCETQPENDIRIIKDPELLNTARCIQNEQSAGRAKWVLPVPRWMARAAFTVLRAITGKNKYTYLLNKAVNPLRTE